MNSAPPHLRRLVFTFAFALIALSAHSGGAAFIGLGSASPSPIQRSVPSHRFTNYANRLAPADLPKLFGFAPPVLASASVITDKSDYRPGESVTITGGGWQAGESIQLTLHREPLTAPDDTFTSVADVNGMFTFTGYTVQPSDFGVMFTLTAAGLTSGATAQTTFMDAPIAFRQAAATSGAAGNGSPVTATFASTPLQNSLIIAVFSSRNSATIPTPSGTGWMTAINQSGSGVTTTNQAIFYKIAGAAESSSVSVTPSSTTTGNGLHIYEYTGIDTTSPFVGSASNSASSGGTVSTGTLTINAAGNYLLFAGLMTRATSASFTPQDTNYAERADFISSTSTNAITLSAEDRIVSVSSAPANFSVSATTGQSAGWRGQIVAFKQAPSLAPTITKSFMPSSITLGGTATVQFKVENPNAATTLTNVSFTDTLPSGLVVANPNNLSNLCGGSGTAASDGATISLSGVTLAGGGSCTLSVGVRATATGTPTNSTQVTGVDGGTTLTGNTANAMLGVTCPSITLGSPAGGAVATGYSGSVAASPAVAGFSYQYSLANSTTLTPGLMLNAATGAITGTPTTSGSFSFDVKAELFDSSNISTGCATMQTKSISVGCPAITVGTPSANGSLNVSYSSSVAASPSVGGFSYQYSLANGTALPAGLMLDASTGAITGTPTNGGPVSFDIKAELFNPSNVSTGCAVTQTRSIDIGCPASQSITAPASVCANSTGNAASVADAGTGATYQWTITNGTITGGQGTRSITFTAGTTSPVALGVTVTASGCMSSGSQNVTVNPLPDATITAPAAVCANSTGNMASVPSAGANATYSWTISGGAFTSATNGAGVTFTAGSTSPVTLGVSVTNANGCSASSSRDITVNALPTADAGPDQVQCQDASGTTTFTLTGMVTNGTAGWNLVTTTGTAAANILSPNSAATNVNVTGTGTVTLRLTATSNASPACASATDEVVLTVNPLPTAAAGSDQAKCQGTGGTTAFSLTGIVTNGTPSWGVVSSTGTASAAIVSPASASTSVNISGVGSVTLRLTSTSNQTPACGTASDDVTLTVNPLPTANAGSNQTKPQASPGPTVFTLNGAVTDGTPSWMVQSTTGTASAMILSPNSASTVINVSGAGSVTLRLTATSNQTPACTADTNDVTLTVVPGARFELTGASVSLADPAVCSGPDNTITVTTTFTNTGNAAQADNMGPEFTAKLPDEFVLVPGSCTASAGTCDFKGTAEVDFNGAVAVNQTVTITYQVQVAPGTAQPFTACIKSTIKYDSNNNGSNDASTSVTNCTTVNCPAAASDQKAGAVLIFPYYTSDTGGNFTRADTLLTVTNIADGTSIQNGRPNYAYLHLFFINANCAPADTFACLTPNGSLQLRASEYDPTATGYLIAVVVDAQGMPTKNNSFIGAAFVHDETKGVIDSYPAASFRCLSALPTRIDDGDAVLSLDGATYDAPPREFAVPLQDPARSEQTVILASVTGNLGTRLSTTGQTGAGVIFRADEQPASFDLNRTGCLLQLVVSNQTFRLVPGTLTGFLRDSYGYLRLPLRAPAVGLLFSRQGVANANRWAGIRALHAIKLGEATLKLPVFSPFCA